MNMWGHSMLSLGDGNAIVRWMWLLSKSIAPRNTPPVSLGSDSFLYAATLEIKSLLIENFQLFISDLTYVHVSSLNESMAIDSGFVFQSWILALSSLINAIIALDAIPDMVPISDWEILTEISRQLVPYLVSLTARLRCPSRPGFVAIWL